MRSFAAAVLLALAGAAVAAPADIPATALLEHIKFLAADELKGRGDGSPELERAADYIADRFRAAGLQPGGDKGTWFQRFDLVAGLTVGEGNELSLSQGGRTLRFVLGTSYYPLATPADAPGSAPSVSLESVPLVFAGYGLVVPSIGYDDYRRVDVDGKAVVIFSHEPQERLSGSAMNGARPVMESTLAAKEGAARMRGARALIVIGDPTHLLDQADYGLFDKDPDAEDKPIPVLRLRRKEAQPLLDHYQLDGLARQIEADLVPRSTALTGATSATRSTCRRTCERCAMSSACCPAATRSGRRRRSSSGLTTTTSGSGVTCRCRRIGRARSTTAPTTTPRAPRR